MILTIGALTLLLGFLFMCLDGIYCIIEEVIKAPSGMAIWRASYTVTFVSGIALLCCWGIWKIIGG